jgi:hypothetical protein
MGEGTGLFIRGFMPRPRLTPSQFEESFWSRVNKSDLSGCWLWTGKTNTYGYGVVYTHGRENVKAHRIAWELSGNPPETLLRHKCDNPPCVNPAHLEPGTNAENSRDMVKRGRNRRGERHGNAKLSDQEVYDIRSLFANGAKQKDLVHQFHSTSATISRICSRKTRIW